MSVETYSNTLIQIKDEYDQKLKALYREYAVSNNTIKVGDIVRDHVGSIKVESIQWRMSTGSQLPFCVYKGLVLKKDGTPTKKQEIRTVWQTQLKKD